MQGLFTNNCLQRLDSALEALLLEGSYLSSWGRYIAPCRDQQICAHLLRRRSLCMLLLLDVCQGRRRCCAAPHHFAAGRSNFVGVTTGVSASVIRSDAALTAFWAIETTLRLDTSRQKYMHFNLHPEHLINTVVGSQNNQHVSTRQLQNRNCQNAMLILCSLHQWQVHCCQKRALNGHGTNHYCTTAHVM